MASKSAVVLGMVLGSIIGSLISSLLGLGLLSFASLFLSSLGGLIGIYVAYRRVKYW